MKTLTLFFFFLCHSSFSNNFTENLLNISSNNEDDKKIHSVFVQILNASVEQAVKKASSKNGFYSNPSIKIPFPESTNNIKSKLIALGLKKQIEEFEYKMNVTAEKASADALNIFLQEIKNLKASNIKKIIDGDKDEATQYLKKNCYTYLYDSFLPIVSKKLENENVVNLWSILLNRYNNLPFVKKIEFDLYDYVTNKTIEGIFVLMTKYEKNIRHNSKSSKSDIIKNFF